MVELDQVVSVGDETVDEREDAAWLPGQDDVDELDVALLLDEAENLTHCLLVDGPSRQGHHLVQQGERVPHATVGLARDRA